MAELTTKEAAERTGLSPWRIAQLAKSGRIQARRFGHAWAIDEESLAAYVPQKGGRKKKAKETGAPPPQVPDSDGAANKGSLIDSPDTIA